MDEAAPRDSELGSSACSTSMLERALCIAADAHRGQLDKGGEPYILHPLRVMLRLRMAEERIVALLHDVVEDSAWHLDARRLEGFSEAVLKAVEILTRRPDEGYEAFIQRVARNPLARRVKLADLEDNLDLSRIPKPTQRDIQRAERYRVALEFLRGIEASIRS